MAKQPQFPIPFRPISSARGLTNPLVVKQDLREWYSRLTGQQFSAEVLVPASGAWTDITNAPPSPLTEVMRLRLPRPEPISLVFHPWTTDTDRFRAPIRLLAWGGVAGKQLEQSQGRIFVEWGAGSARMWTYFDAAQGSLQLPAVSDVRISAWSHTTDFILSASAQVGYSHADLFATFSVGFYDTATGNLNVLLPQFSRTLTGYFEGVDLNDTADIRLRGGTGLIYQRWLLRPAITPNPQTIPYAPVDVPISGHCRWVRVEITNTAGGLDTVVAVVKVQI